MLRLLRPAAAADVDGCACGACDDEDDDEEDDDGDEEGISARGGG